MFYTNNKQSRIIIPRLESIAAFDSAIKAGQKNLDALHHQQYLLMLKNDVKGMAALDAPIKDAEKDLDGLKIGLGVTMGANIHGKAGNQLTQQNDERAPQVGKPQFAKNDTSMHVTALSDKLEYPPEPQTPPQQKDIPAWDKKLTEDGNEAKQNAQNSQNGSKRAKGNIYISEKDCNDQLKDLESQLEMREKLAGNYSSQLGVTPYSDPNYNLYQDGYNRNLGEAEDLKKQIKELKDQRDWSKKYELVKDNKLFNNTGFINDQNALGETTPFGSKGNAADSCCGSIAAQNINLLFGENSNFADVYTYFNDDSKLLGGGKLGVNPFALKQYLEDEGHKVTVENANADSLKEPGKFIYTYLWYTPQNGWGAHYMAGENNGKSIEVYNPYKAESNANDIQSFFDADLNMVTFKDNYDPMQKIKKLIPFYDKILPQDDGVGFVMRVD